MPPAVLIELERGREICIDLPDVHGLPWLIRQAPEGLDRVPTAAELGAEEKEVLAFGLQLPGSVVVLDDRLARLHAAALGLAVTGTLGIILRAKRKGHLSKLEPVIEELNGLGFRLSPRMRAAVLRLASE